MTRRKPSKAVEEPSKAVENLSPVARRMWQSNLEAAAVLLEGADTLDALHEPEAAQLCRDTASRFVQAAKDLRR